MKQYASATAEDLRPLPEYLLIVVIVKKSERRPEIDYQIE